MFKTYPDTPGWQKTDTSKAAADDMAPKAATIRDMVLRALRERDMTSYELADALRLEYHTIQPRTSELRAKHKIIDSLKRRKGPTGKLGIVWKAV
jgi:hypothetical protein